MTGEPVDIPLPDGRLRALRWGDGPDVVVALHGITSSALAWQAVAERMPAGWRLIAPDLRGRGHSAHLPGPYGLRRHAADAAALIEFAGGRAVLAGHSLGAYVALLARDARPDLVSRLVLVDGGLPLPTPPGADLDAVLDASLGPAIARLSQTFPTAASYVEFWQAHPAFAGAWNSYAEAYVLYDLVGEEGSLRSRAAPAAVRDDGRDLLAGTQELGEALDRLTEPTPLLTAPGGMFGAPPGMLPPSLVEPWALRVPALRPRLVPDTNHYTLLFAPESVALIAAVLTGDDPE